MTVQSRQQAEAARRRLVAHLGAGTTDLAPEVMTNSVLAYTDKKRFQNELNRIFLEHPIVVGLTKDASETGDGFLVEELGRSIIVVRGNDGTLNAYLNMCRHRGTRLLGALDDKRCFHARSLVCPFHGWTYALDGQLKSVPGRVGFDSVNLDAHNLIPVPIFEEFGLIFLGFTPGSVFNPRAYIEGLAQDLNDLSLNRLVRVSSSELQAECNWKLAVDTYAESYHFGVLHAQSMGNAYVGNVSAFDAYGPHWRAHFAERNLKALIDLPESDWPQVRPGGVVFLFPNTILVIGTDEVGLSLIRLFSIFPGKSVRSTRCRIDFYADRQSVFVSGGIETGDDATSDVTREDYAVAVAAQANYESAPPDFQILYGRNEPGVQAFHCAVESALGVD